KDRPQFSPFVGQPSIDGNFRLEAITPGRYAVFVASDYEVSGFYSDPVYFEVVDQDVNDIEIRALRGLTLSGSVITENQDLKELLRQLPNLRVSVNVVPAGARNDDPSQRSGGSALVMPDGTFQVSGLRAG